MRIVFDEPKRQWTIQTRGYDFADLDLGFFSRATITASRDGRFQAVGEFRAETISVIFRPLGREALAIISMRRASQRERNRP